MPEGAECVKVAIRCRPPSKKEIANNEDSIVELTESFKEGDDPGEVVLNDPAGVEEPAKFAFDIVFGLSILQSQVYEAVGVPAMLKTFEGYNGTIFAYGQTGSGKSWSMCGANDPPELRGITPRMNEALFEKIKIEQVGTKKFLVMCSYFEIYNEIIFDLLNPVADRGKLGGGLQIKEHPVMGIYVKDLTEIMAENAKKLEDLLDSGIKNRAVSSTMMNSVSSRSHSIFTIKVHQKDDDDPQKSVFAKLNLVDLAGSERQKGTGATGQTLKEGANINKSLSALGNVINALVESANGKKVFIPYRNSKLTRVLQESLGGNSLCTMLATLSPAACNYEETMSTLRYANRAKAIKVSATKNEEASQISRLKAEVEELKKKLASSAGGGGGAAGLTEEEREAERQNFQKQLKEMELMMNSNWGDKAKISEEHQKRMDKIAEERRIAQQALDEERARRLKLLQEKNDLELSIRALIDFVLHLPKLDNAPAVLTGEQPRQWLKLYRTLRQQMGELKDQKTLLQVFHHGLDEDIKLWGEGIEGSDWGLAATGLNRCHLKLDKLRKGADKLQSLESNCSSSSRELADAVKVSHAELEKFRQSFCDEACGEEGQARATSLEEVNRMMSLLGKQIQEKIDEQTQSSVVELKDTCNNVIQYASGQGCGAECDMLTTLLADPSLAKLPPGMPAKPLREYSADEVSDTPESTEALLEQLIQWEALCAKTRKSPSELLSRPPPKFIMEVACAVKAATGFPQGFLEDWPDAREDKLARLQSIVDAVNAGLGLTIDFFDPQDVLKGKEVSKTLRLMQLLAVAAARHMPADAAAPPAQSGGSRSRVREMPAMLSAMGNCIKAAKVKVEALREAAGAAEGDDQGLQQQLTQIEQQLEDAKTMRKEQEEAFADAQRRLADVQAEAKQISTECEIAQSAPQADDPELQELERQVQHLSKSSPEDMPEEVVLETMTWQLEELRKQLERDEGYMAGLEEKHQELSAAVRDAESTARRLDAELQRERQRQETEQELLGQSPEEQKTILRAHEQKLRTKVGTLEAQVSVLQREAEERKAANLQLVQQGKDLESKAADMELQIQIVQEERDGLREALQQLWDQKNVVDEEMASMAEGYIGMTERCNEKQDEVCDLQERLASKREEAERVRKNGFEIALN
mmetsp:Transcript_57346/g.166485  ORF Transcript_57346/g.166485 Transcript_57346/m.166485 type:complete len:1154 (+) Transcript_57346:139-3600(+)